MTSPPNGDVAGRHACLRSAPERRHRAGRVAHARCRRRLRALLALGSVAAPALSWMAEDNRLPSSPARSKVRFVHGDASLGALSLSIDYAVSASEVGTGSTSVLASLLAKGRCASRCERHHIGRCGVLRHRREAAGLGCPNAVRTARQRNADRCAAQGQVARDSSSRQSSFVPMRWRSPCKRRSEIVD